MEISAVSARALGNTSPKLNKPSVRKREKEVKNWCWTFNNYLPSDINNLISAFLMHDIKYLFSEEIGNLCETPHLQGFCKLKIKKSFSAFKKMIGIDKIHIEECRGSEQSNITYCTKSEGKTYTNIKLDPTVKPIKILNCDDLLPFQKSIEEYCTSPMNEEDEGKIFWVYDPIGRTGKTKIMKYLSVRHNIPFAYGGKCADIINLIFNNKKYMTTADIPVVIYNFGRDTDARKISYKSMEQISDGCICNTKYEAGCFVMNCPKVVVLANCLPAIDKMTESRWILKSIDEKKELVDIIPTISFEGPMEQSPRISPLDM